MTLRYYLHNSIVVSTSGDPPKWYQYDIRNLRNHPLPWKARSIFVLVLVSQATCGLDVEVSVQLVNEYKVDVELLAVELQAQISKPLHLQQGAFQGLHG